MRGLECRWLAIALVAALAADARAQAPREVKVKWAPDATENLKKALAGGNKTVIVPCVGLDWVISDSLRVYSGTTLILEPGVVLMAAKGAFRGKGACMLYAERRDKDNATNITICGYKAVIRMRKDDYMNPDYKPAYPKSEWRHCIRLRAVTDVEVLGLALESSGGDGLYIGGGGFEASKDVEARDLVCRNNLRQGISVTSAIDLTIENCTLRETSGGHPQSGIDLEPNLVSDKMKGIAIRNCHSLNNAGHGYVVYLNGMDEKSEDVDITFTNCHAAGNGTGEKPLPAVWVEASKTSIPKGHVVFNNCKFYGPKYYGAVVKLGRSDRRLKFEFARCTWQDVAQRQDHVLDLHVRRAGKLHFQGGIVLNNCKVDDTGRAEREVYHIESLGGSGAFNVRGRIEYYYFSEDRHKTVDIKGPPPGP